MSKFKVGANVRCTRKGTTHLTLGNVYKVQSVVADGIRIINDNMEHSYYYDSCFELATKYPNPPHKHKDLIIAWANGAEIEALQGGSPDTWIPIVNPSWLHHVKYRIKPTKTENQLLKEELLAKVKELEGKIKEIDSE